MSPSRTRRPVHRHRSRRELFTAIGGAVGVVLVTAIMVWLLRPGPSGTQGTGGLGNRQPRATWLVGITIFALLVFAWWAFRQQRRWRGRAVIVMSVGGFIILLAAVTGGFLWPGGLLRHPPPSAPALSPEDIPTTLPPDQTTVPARPHDGRGNHGRARADDATDRRAVTDAAVRAAFAAAVPFPLDPFQVRALDALDLGRSVLVAAPTGSGKTLVAEYAIAKSLAAGTKTFYTTPLKALSNQKYGDLVRAHGADKVGLLTGDNAINGDAPIVVMTTEVLRNMIYARSPTLEGLRTVVLDEVHYLQDPSRGAVWEEVIIHLPADIGIVALSATVSNAEEVAAWMQTVRGETEAIIEERRPVELVHLYMVGDRSAEQLHLLPTFTDQSGESAPNPVAARLDQRTLPAHARPAAAVVLALAQRGRRAALGRADAAGDRVRVQSRRLRPGRRPVRRRGPAADHVDGTPRAAQDRRTAHRRAHRRRPRRARLRLVARRARGRLRRAPRGHGAADEGSGRGGVRGAGLLKVVFATETLSLGINMPARTVVIEKLSKFTGRAPRVPDARRVHAARGARRPPRHRRPRLRRRAVEPVRRVRTGGRARVRAARTRSRRRSARPTTWPPTSCAGTRPNRPGTS